MLQIEEMSIRGGESSLRPARVGIALSFASLLVPFPLQSLISVSTIGFRLPNYVKTRFLQRNGDLKEYQQTY